MSMTGSRVLEPRGLCGLFFRGVAFRSLWMIVAFALWAPQARADYTLSSGDVVEVLVYRMPDMSRTVTVDVDGRIAVPPLGMIDVIGRSAADVSADITQRLAGQRILDNPQVTVSVTAARPVIVSGDVAEPGARPFRAGLTVRQAIALAGGLGGARGRGLDEAATLRGDRDALGVDLFREQARIARLQALMSGTDKLELPDGAGTGLPADVRTSIVTLESRQLQASVDESAQEKAHLERAAALVQTRLDTLNAQQALQQQLITEQSEQVQRMQDIQTRGLASKSRVADERRFFQAMQERAAANESEIAYTKGLLEDAQHAVERFDERRRSALETEQRDALLAAEGIRTRLAATDERLAQLGIASRDFVSLTLYREVGGTETVLPADQATVLEPGDTIDVVIDLPRTGAASLPSALTTGKSAPSQ